MRFSSCWLSRLFMRASAFLPPSTTLKWEMYLPHSPRLRLISCCATICLQLLNSHSPYPYPPRSQDEIIFSLFIFFFAHNHSLQSPLGTRRLRPVSSQPVLTYTLRSQKWFLGDQIEFVSSVKAFRCFAGSITNIPIAPGILATLLRNRRSKGHRVPLCNGDGG